MTRYLLGLICLYATVACGQNLSVDKSNVRFVGSACKALGPDQISFDGDRLIIDLSAIEALSRLNPKASCLIKIPYQGGKGRSTIAIDGHYDLAPEDQLALSWRFDASGALGPSKVLSLSETSQGRLSWSDSLNFETADSESSKEGLLRISLYFDWKPGSSPEAVAKPGSKVAEPISKAPLVLKSLTLTGVGEAGKSGTSP